MYKNASNIVGHYHGEPSEAGDCSNPPHKMATAESLTSGKADFNRVAEHHMDAIFVCEQVLYMASLRYSKGWSPRARITWRNTRIFRPGMGASVERGGWLRIQTQFSQVSVEMTHWILVHINVSRRLQYEGG